MDQETVYSENPVELAKHWESKRAERLHVVDLNGAVKGRPFHRSLVVEIARSLRIPIEVGGGIRDLQTIEHYLSSGARWVILGTAAFQNRSLVDEACHRFPEQIILAIDAQKGQVVIQGWNEVVSLKTIDLARQFDGKSLSAIIYTDTERDGMGTGLNLEMTRVLARSTTVPMIASGGVSKIEDIERLMELEPDGVIGVIVGRAIYTGQIDLEKAIRLAKGSEARSQKPE